MLQIGTQSLSVSSSLFLQIINIEFLSRIMESELRARVGSNFVHLKLESEGVAAPGVGKNVVTLTPGLHHLLLNALSL